MVYSRRIVESKHNLGASHNIKNKAKELCGSMTDTEKILWNHLRKKKQHGFYFRRQHPYNIYILDFYCFKANLAIEIDGKIHLGQKGYDKERTKFLESSGLKVMRFKNEDIESKIDFVIEVINKHLGNNQPPVKPFTERKESRKSLSPVGETGKGVRTTKEINNLSL
jgi:very-short-patch-repair endonuclease